MDGFGMRLVRGSSLPTLPPGVFGLDTDTSVLYVGTGTANVAVGTVTSVGLDGGTTGLTFSGSPVTGSGTVTLGGTLAVSGGGTGAGSGGPARTNLGIPSVIFDHYADVGNSGTSETDLYSDTLAAGRLAADGEKVEAQYVGVFVSHATATRQVRVYFGGTQVFDTGALTLSLSSAWDVYATVIRVSSSAVRCAVSLTTEGAALAAYTAYTEVTGLTLADAQVMKVTGTAAGVGAASNDIVAKLGRVVWYPAA